MVKMDLAERLTFSSMRRYHCFCGHGLLRLLNAGWLIEPYVGSLLLLDLLLVIDSRRPSGRHGLFGDRFPIQLGRQSVQFIGVAVEALHCRYRDRTHLDYIHRTDGMALLSARRLISTRPSQAFALC